MRATLKAIGESGSVRRRLGDWAVVGGVGTRVLDLGDAGTRGVVEGDR